MYELAVIIIIIIIIIIITLTPLQLRSFIGLNSRNRIVTRGMGSLNT